MGSISPSRSRARSSIDINFAKKRWTHMSLGEESMQNNRSPGESANKVVTPWLACGRMALAILLAVAFTVADLAQASYADESNHHQHWIGTWGNALHQPDLGVPGLANSGFTNQTLRQIVHISVGGP